MKKVWKTLENYIEQLSRLGVVVAEIGLVLLLVLVFHEVIVRYLLNKPTLYSVEISEYLLLLVAFMAAGWVLQEDKHVSMQTFVSLMPPKVKQGLALLTSVIVLLFCTVLIWEGIRSSLLAYKGGYHSSSLLNVPMWIPYAIIPIGSLLLALQMLVRIGKLIENPADRDNS